MMEDGEDQEDATLLEELITMLADGAIQTRRAGSEKTREYGNW